MNAAQDTGTGERVWYRLSTFAGDLIAVAVSLTLCALFVANWLGYRSQPTALPGPTTCSGHSY